MKKLTKEEFIAGLKDNAGLFEMQEQIDDLNEMAGAVAEHDEKLAELFRNISASLMATVAYVKTTYGS